MPPRARTKNKHLPPRMHKKPWGYYYVSFVGGKSKWIPLGNDFGVALQKWADLEGRKIEGETVADAITRYTSQVMPALAASTQKIRTIQLGRLRAVFGHMRLADVRPMHIARYLDESVSKVSANREMSLLSSIYAYAMRWGWTDSNPCRGVRRNPENARDRYITDEEYRALLDAADEQWKCIIELTYLTAARRGDMMKARLSDIGKDTFTIRQGKTAARVQYEITPQLAALLDRIKRLRRRVSTMLLFATRNGQPYSESGWESSFRRIREKAGVEGVTFHDLRAKALTDAKRVLGRDYAQALAGHADGSMTEAYIRAREAIAVRPLEPVKKG